MTKLSRAVLACLSATIMLLIVASIAAADTFTYALNGSYAESNGGPLLIPNGGTLGPDSATGLGTAHSSAVQRAIYLKPGLVVTAAHLTVSWTADLSVHIAGAVLPANLVKQGEFEEVDLSLFSVDDQKLPERVARIQTSLCQAAPWPGDQVIVVDQAGATRSHIVGPQILPLAVRTKFRTLIGDVASTGNSGSDVFDPNRQCLLGVTSRKFVVGGKDVAKYFVPASEIREFIPIERRDQVLIN